MRKLKNMLIMAAVIVVFVAAGAIQALACSAVYVGSDVSTDGSTIIARSEDQGSSWGHVNKRWQVVDRVENTPGRYLEVYWSGKQFELPATTYKYTMVQDFDGADGDYAGSCVNENGVSITATVTGNPSSKFQTADRRNGDVEEAMMANYIAAVADNARDGIEKLGALIATRGMNEGNIIIVADQNEAWYMEMYTGHHWVAVKMPTDKVAAFGNSYMLTTDYDETDPDSFMCSTYNGKNIFEFVTETGLGVYDTDGKLNLSRTFSATKSAGNQTRNWGGHHFLAPSDNLAYDIDTDYPLFFEPDADVSPMDVLKLMRYKLEDTDQAGGRGFATYTSSQVHMLQTFADMPAETAVLQWICLGDAEHGMFVPSWSGITDVHSTYKAAQTNDYNEDGAFLKFKRISALAVQNRERYSAGVRNVWELYENTFYDYLMANRDAVKNGNVNVTQLGKDMADVTFNQADKLYEDLLYYAMWNTGRTSARSFEGTVNLTMLKNFGGYTVSNWSDGVPTATLGDGSKTYYTFEVDPTNLKADYNAGNAVSSVTDDDNNYYYAVPSNGHVFVAYSLVSDLPKPLAPIYPGNPDPGGDPDDPAQFVDIGGHWAYDAMMYCIENGLMNGTSDTTFSPDASMTRAMLVTVLWRFEGEPAATSANTFSDVANGQWYTNAVLWASENGIVVGDGKGAFGTNDNITREQIVTIIMRYAKWKGLDTSASADLSGYSDAGDISDWAREAMQWANAEKIMTGRTATTLAPKGASSRAEVATILMRLIEDFIK